MYFISTQIKPLFSLYNKQRRVPYSGDPTVAVCFTVQYLAALENDAIFHRPEFYASALERADFLLAEILTDGPLPALVGTVNIPNDAHGSRSIRNAPCLDFVQARNDLELQYLLHKSSLFLTQPHGSLGSALLPSGIELLLQLRHVLSSFSHSYSPNIKIFHS